MPKLLLQTCVMEDHVALVCKKDRYYRALGKRNVRESAQIAETLSFGLAREFGTLLL
jgi:hypothetical protein